MSSPVSSPSDARIRYSARRVLAETRRSMYRILAEDDTADTAANAGAADDPDDADGEDGAPEGAE